MAIAKAEAAPMSTGRRLLVGTNVILIIAIVAGIVVVLQAMAYSMTARWDMTSSRVNSLGDGTINLLRSLDHNIRLTSLYFETDREEVDQPRYRSAARNLLDLYEATNRAKITADWINPLKDREKFQKLTERLREKPAYKDAVAAYRAPIEEYKTTLDDQMRALVKSEVNTIASLSTDIGGTEQKANAAIAGVENLFMQVAGELDATREQVDALTSETNPQCSAAVSQLQNLYRAFGDALKKVAKFGAEQSVNPQMPPAQASFLREAGSRYGTVLSEVEAATTKLQDLQPLKVDDLLRELGPTTNPILVETDSEARVVDFGSVWPPMDERGGTRAGFDQRAFKGEEKLTSAILRATHKDQTAVVFVRYGGMPLFMGGFMPGQPAAPYATMKQHLEDANFIVEEWDLKTSTTVPKIDPAPTRTLFVVFKPMPPERGPMGQPSQEPPFAETHRKALLNALGDKGRAVFITGWAPGPFGPIASTYEYNDYLKTTWGVDVNASALIIEFTSGDQPGRYVPDGQGFAPVNLEDLDVLPHDIVRGAQARQLGLPLCAPLNLSASPPEGVSYDKLVIQPKSDGVWGVKNISQYQEQLRERQYATKVEGDLEGPFDLAVAATKGDAKIVVISSSNFAADQVAFAQEMSLGPQGLIIRSRNPGNVTLLVNSLHWLNDNTRFMNIGKPIDAAVLQIEKKSTEKVVQFMTIFLWPAMALGCGGVVWWVRRK